MIRLFCYAVCALFIAACSGSKSNKVADDSISMKSVSDTSYVVDSSEGSSVSSDQTNENSVDSGKVLVPHNGRPSMLDFTATWCPPCRKMKPIVEELTDTYEDMMNFVVIDIDENEDLANQYAIEVIPTYIFIDRKGNVLKRVEGAVEQEVLENQINMMITN